MPSAPRSTSASASASTDRISGRHLIDGAFWAFLAEGLMAPTMLITAAYLSRKLGPAGYGLLTVAFVTVSWFEWSVSAFFARATIKFVSEAQDWRPVATTVIRWHLGLGLAAMALVVLLAGPLARLLGEPALRAYLWMASVDIPIFAMAHGHRHVLIGLGRFRGRALGSGLRWPARLFFVIVLVELGFSIEGAIAANIGASVVELAVTRYFVPVPFLGGASFPLRSMLTYIAPLSVLALSTRIFEKADLFMLKSLGATAAEAGFYAAAQNLALLPSIFALSFGLPLLTALTRHAAAGDRAAFALLTRNALRASMALLLLGGVVAGADFEIVRLVYGADFSPAGPILRLLMFAAIVSVAFSFTTAALTAAGYPNTCFFLGAVLIPLAVAAHAWIIPAFGASGAASVTLGIFLLVTAAAGFLVWRLTETSYPWPTLMRCLAASVAVFLAGRFWPADGWLLMLKLGVLSVLALAALFLLGELNREERLQIRQMLGRALPSFRNEESA